MHGVTLNAGNSSNCSFVRLSASLTGISVSGNIKVDILAIVTA